MSALDYRDLVLVADDVTTGGDEGVESFSVRVFDSPVGQARGKERVTVPAGLPAAIRALGDRLHDFEPSQQILVGRALGEMLLPPGAREFYRRSLASLFEGQGLRLRLRLDDALAPIPWEHVWVPEASDALTGLGAFLALRPRVSIARHEALPIPADWSAPQNRRRVVVAAASPRPYDLFPMLESLGVERAALREELGQLPGMQVDLLPFNPATDGRPGVGTTPGHVLKAMLEARADIFHFMGHGHRDPKTGEPRLILADDADRAVPILPDVLAQLLGQRGIRLVVLCACDSGARSGTEWGGVASALLGAGIPAVVAMQSRVGDRLGAAFSVALYRALVAGLTVDEAVFQGRIAVRAASLPGTPHVRDWGVPVLYLRSSGGAIFDPLADPDLVRQAKEAGSLLVRQHVETLKAGGEVVGVLADDPGMKVRVEQDADLVGGLLVGGVLFGTSGERLSVVQRAKTVVQGGRLTGAVLGRQRPQEKGSEEAFDHLLGLLRGGRPG